MCPAMKEPTRTTTDSIADFLAEYASWLLGCGATCIRIQKNVDRMARRFGCQVGITVMPTYVEIMSDGVTARRIHNCGINFDLNARLSRLSWEVADRRYSLEQAKAEFQKIINTPRTNPIQVLFQASIANAAFCRLFQGDAAAVAVVFIATLAGFRIRQIMLDRRIDFRLTVICAAFVAATISSACYLFGWGHTPEIALGTSVLYLIPGVPYINAVSDMMDKHYLSAYSRFMDALIITACITIGLVAAMFLMGIKILS